MQADSDFNERHALWKAVRSSPFARDAAAKGVAWSLKCAVLDDGKRPHQIDLRTFVAAKARAALTAQKIQAGQRLTYQGRDVGTMPPKDAERALAMYRQLALLEAKTAEEILLNSSKGANDAA